MLIQLVKQWRRMPAGNLFDPGDGVGDLLIRRGFAKVVQNAGTDQQSGASDRANNRTADDRGSAKTTGIGKR